MNKKVKILIVLVLAFSMIGLSSCFLNQFDEGPIETPGETTIYFGESSNQGQTTAEKEMAALDVLNDAFGNTAEVYKDDYLLAYYIVPSGGQQFANEVALAKLGNEEYQDDWDVLTINLVAASMNISEYLSGYSLILLNPVDTDLTLFVVTDGQIIFDAVYE